MKIAFPPISSVTPGASQSILQLIPTLEAGGAERTTVDITKALVRNGFCSIVGTQGGRMEAQIIENGGLIYHLPLDSKAPHVLLRNAIRLRSLIEDYDISLIHARSRAPAWSALVAARQACIPLVTTYHGIYNARTPLKRLYNSAMVRGDAVIANSQWTADHIRQEHGIARERINVIPRGVDLEEFDPYRVSPGRADAMRRQWQAAEDDIVILLPGRLTRWKGQLILIAAVAQLARSSKAGHIKAILLGHAQGRDSYVRELFEAITAAGLIGRIRIEEPVTDMPAAYLASDIVISASTDPEAFGRVAAEAAAMGRPVIASDHGGARETVLPDRSGILVPPGDVAALANGIEGLISILPEDRMRMGQEGRSHIAAHFSLERMCADTLAVYRRLLSEKPAVEGNHRL